MPNDVPILARRQVREAVVAALQRHDVARTILSPGDWTSQPEKLPAVLVRVTRGGKEQLYAGQSNFTTVITIELETRVSANTAIGAQDELDALDARLEQALLSSSLIRLVQRLQIETESEFSSEARTHLAGTRWQLRCELMEQFMPELEDLPLEGVDVHVDLVNHFDKTGTYATPFPDAVAPAPRGAGPDGRDEGGLSITFNT